jgi:hypothetical protein
MNAGLMIRLALLAASIAPVKPALGAFGVSVGQAATGSLSGIVSTASDTPQPVARAVVTLSGPELSRSRGTITNDKGRFRINELPAGRFTVRVEKPGFITSVYGAQRPARPGTAVAVKQGEHVENLAVRIWQGAVLTGTVRDADGRPSAGTLVRAYRNGGTSTQPMPVLTNNGATTDERGQYRIFGLEPGAYVLSARSPIGQASAQVLTDRRVDDLLSMLQRGQRTGFAATGGDTSESARSFAPTFYPGTSAIEQAQVLTLRAGEELEGLDFAIISIPVSTLSGVVRLPDGSPVARATVRFSRWPRSTVVSSFTVLVQTATTGEDGVFSLAQMTPGTYKVTARWRSTRPGGGIIDPNEQPQWASTEVAVGTTDLSGITLTLGPGALVQGRITFVRDGVEQPVPTNINSMTIGAEALNSGTSLMSANIRPDGSFSMSVLTGEPLRLGVFPRGLDSAWAVRSALLATGADWLDAPVTIDGATMLTVAMTTHRSELSGQIHSADGAAVPDLFVIAFSTDRRFWGIETRRVQAVRPAADGAFIIKDLPPGEYFLGALVDVDNGDWIRPGFLDPIATVAVKVTIAEGAKTVQDIKIGSGR